MGGSGHKARHREKRAQWQKWHTLSLPALLMVVFVSGFILADQLIAWLITMLALSGAIVLIGHGTTGLWTGLLVDSRNKMSLSRLQLSLWTVLVLSAFLTIAVFNIRDDPTADSLNIGVPPEVWGLLGISTGSFVTAATIKSQKKTKEASEAAKDKTEVALERVGEDPDKLAHPQGVLVAYNKPKDASVADLFKGDEVVAAAYLDLGKVQVFLFTLIVVISYAANVGGIFYYSQDLTSLPNLSTGILALLGISHAGYLTAKAIPFNPAEQQSAQVDTGAP